MERGVGTEVAKGFFAGKTPRSQHSNNNGVKCVLVQLRGTVLVFLKKKACPFHLIPNPPK